MKSVDGEDLKPLIRMVWRDRGMDLSNYRERYLRRRIGVRLRASGAQNLNHYLKLLDRSPDEYRAFIGAITINTSSFFRNRGCFEIIEREILPAVADMVESAARRPPHVWSVGCARGEEAYSLALLLCAHHPLTAAATRPPILATDIDEEALLEARQALYGRRALAGVPGPFRERFFARAGHRQRLADGIRGLVDFARHDVLRDARPGRFSLVVCRNVLIYLEKEPQEKIMSRLAEALHPGGYLVLGKSEILTGEARGLFVPVSPAERIYRKTGCDEAGSQTGPAPRRVA